MGFWEWLREWRAARRQEREREQLRLDLAMLTQEINTEVRLRQMTPGRWALSAKGYRPVLGVTPQACIREVPPALVEPLETAAGLIFSYQMTRSPRKEP